MSDAMDLLDKFRQDGWTVTVHNDYRINGQRNTFWLLTHPDGTWVKGEGHDDLQALKQCRNAVLYRMSHLNPSRTIRFVVSLLGMMPNGLAANTLHDVMVQQGVDPDTVGVAVRTALDRGLICLGKNLNLVRANGE